MKRPAAVVVLDVDCHDGVFELVLVNLGPGVATEIGVTFSAELKGLRGTRSILDLPVWSRIRTLRPGKEIRVLLDSTERLREEEACNRFSARVAWTSGREQHEETYHHDLEAYCRLPHLVVPNPTIAPFVPD